MLRRLAALIAAALATLVVAAPAAALDRPMTIRVVSSLVSERVVDRAPKGRASTGDRVVTVSQLRNGAAQFGKGKGVRIGRDRATLAFQRDGTVRLFGTATLPGGTIRFDGQVTAMGPVVLRVVGGTGRYRNAAGTVAVTDLDNRGSALNVYRLVPSGSGVA